MNLNEMQQKDYRSIPFYSLNDELEEGRLREQIRFMHKQGIGGFFLHARGGLETEYLSEEWFRLMEAAVDEAKKLGMDVWFYDENGWPSGFAGGELLKEGNYVAYLELKEESAYSADAFASYVLVGQEYRRVTGEQGKTVYYNIYVCYNHSYVDLLDPEVTRQFISSTHEKYYERFKKEFGKTVAGFFTDEPQYFREALPWSKVIPSEFRKAYGYDVADGLICLFKSSDGAFAFRNDFWKLVSRLFVENYQKQVYDWCNAHGCLCTGHTIEETSLYGQMMCCAGVMPYYEYLHIPGIDWLTNFVYNEVSPKQLSSVCEQLGKSACITETFGASGHSATPSDFKAIAQFQYVAGVSLMCQHLFPYSVRGQRKRDFPPYFSPHSAWTDCSAEFNLYFTRLGQIIAENREDTQILLLHPLYSAYALYDKYDPSTLAEVETSFHETAALLVENHLPHHFGDERLMQKYAEVKDGKLLIGRQKYTTVIMSRSINISAKVFSLLEEFAAEGGRLVLVNSPEYIEGRKADRFLQKTTTLEEVLSSTKTKVESDGRAFLRSRRSKDWFYIISTCREKEISARVFLAEVQTVCGYDIEKDKYYAVQFEKGENGVYLDLRFVQNGAMLFRLNAKVAEENAFVSRKSEDVTGRFRLQSYPQNYLPLDFARLSKDGTNFGEKLPLCKIMDRLLYARYEGDIWLQFDFFAENITEEISFGAERIEGAEYFLNGKKLDAEGGTQSRNSELRLVNIGVPSEGENCLVAKIPFRQSEYIYHVLFDEGVTESLRNKLTLATELETVFLAGNFCVKSETKRDMGGYLCLSGKQSIVKKGEHSASGDVVAEGYPFLHEKLCVNGCIECEGGIRAALRIKNTFDAVSVYVNDRFAGNLTFENELEITEFIQGGKNEVALVCSPSSQNFYGPLHFKQYDTITVTPYCFGYQNNYCGDDPNWTDDYFVKKQGIQSVELLKGDKR